MTEIIIAGGPEQTTVPGQWRVLLNETPSADWRDRLVELVAADPVTATLRIELEGPALLYTRLSVTPTRKRRLCGSTATITVTIGGNRLTRRP